MRIAVQIRSAVGQLKAVMGAVNSVIGRLNGKLDFGKLIRIKRNAPGAIAVVVP